MKKILKTIIPILAFGLIAYMVYAVVQKINYKKAVAQHIKTMPQFNYQTLSGKPFGNKNLKPNTPTIFLYFNSECEHCQSEAVQIQENIKRFKNVQLIFISFEKPNTINTFAQKHQLIGYDNIHFIRDYKVSFATTFDIKSLPSVVIYNQENQFVEKIKGEVKIDNILKKIKLK